ncbi:MAG: hypothetical protein ACYS5F_14515 [Planctomycetota bacterium]|jgi:hypothetical protein
MGVLDKLKGRMSGPGKTPLGRPTEPVSEQVNNNASIDTSKGSSFPKGASDAVIQQWYANNSTGQPTLDADRLDDSNYGKDSLFTKLKTAVSNPFNSVVAAMGTNPDMQDLRQVRQLSEAKDRGDKDAKEVLARSSALNTASSFIPIAATADAVASTLEGDPTALITKKLNKIKPIAKGLTKLKLDPTKTAKVLSSGLKVAKKI